MPASMITNTIMRSSLTRLRHCCLQPIYYLAWDFLQRGPLPGPLRLFYYICSFLFIPVHSCSYFELPVHIQARAPIDLFFSSGYLFIPPVYTSCSYGKALHRDCTYTSTIVHRRPPTPSVNTKPAFPGPRLRASGLYHTPQLQAFFFQREDIGQRSSRRAPPS